MKKYAVYALKPYGGRRGHCIPGQFTAELIQPNLARWDAKMLAKTLHYMGLSTWLQEIRHCDGKSIEIRDAFVRNRPLVRLNAQHTPGAGNRPHAGGQQ